MANGTGSKAYIEGYRVGGKTGTAQKFIDGSYSSSKYVASFIGFAPANDPELVCLVAIDEPGSYPVYGGTIAAPVFQKVVADTLSYLGIEPQVTEQEANKVDGDTAEEELKKETLMLPSVLGLSRDEAEALLQEKKLTVEFSGSGDVVESQLPGALSKVEEGSKVILTLGSSAAASVATPDLSGKRLLECGEILSALGLTMEPSGSGTAVAQDPAPGTALNRGDTVYITFSGDDEEIPTLAP